MKNIDLIRNRIIKIRECLDRINGEDIYFEYKPIADFKDKLDYPIDFQIFMEEIGELVSGHEGGQEGMLLLEIKIPRPLIGNDDLVVFNDFVQGDKINNNSKVENVRVFGRDVDAQNFGFDTNTSPFKLVCLGLRDDIKKKFLEWFVNFVNSKLDEDPWFKKDVRLK